jgi:hypothetical protein
MATTATIDELQKQHAGELARFVGGLSGKGADSDWALVRALVHRAVHLVAERKAGEYCAVATLLAEMISHAHQVMHPGDDKAAAHHDVVH